VHIGHVEGATQFRVGGVVQKYALPEKSESGVGVPASQEMLHRRTYLADVGQIPSCPLVQEAFTVGVAGVQLGPQHVPDQLMITIRPGLIIDPDREEVMAVLTLKKLGRAGTAESRTRSS
jgi:hypothetical protein